MHQQWLQILFVCNTHTHTHTSSHPTPHTHLYPSHSPYLPTHLYLSHSPHHHTHPTTTLTTPSHSPHLHCKKLRSWVQKNTVAEERQDPSRDSSTTNICSKHSEQAIPWFNYTNISVSFSAGLVAPVPALLDAALDTLCPPPPPPPSRKACLQLKAPVPFWAEVLLHHRCHQHSVDHSLLLPVGKVPVWLIHLSLMYEGHTAVGIAGAWGKTKSQECQLSLSNTTACDGPQQCKPHLNRDPPVLSLATKSFAL